MFTLAAPTQSPAFVNSVISWGRITPSGAFSRSYQPQPGRSSKSLPKPEMFVESARSAEQTRKSGRPYFSRA